ncbi:MAG: hypothetical protein QOF90_2137 [Acetobacteraceae bacterium]|nr:hypothetical protein [Acetobacteraceae bacterium]
MSRIGIAISGGPNPADIVDLVVLAESLGYESAWVAEGHGGNQFAILAACATRTSRIRLGTSISNVFVRTAPPIAMAASTIADLSGGRFILGLGSSHKAQVEPEHGVVYGKPLTRTREAPSKMLICAQRTAPSVARCPASPSTRCHFTRRSPRCSATPFGGEGATNG